MSEDWSFCCTVRLLGLSSKYSQVFFIDTCNLINELILYFMTFIKDVGISGIPETNGKYILSYMYSSVV